MSDLATRTPRPVSFPSTALPARAPAGAGPRSVRCTLGLANRAMAAWDWLAAFAGVAAACAVALGAAGGLRGGQVVLLALFAATMAGLALKGLQAHRSERYRRASAWLPDAALGAGAAGTFTLLMLAAFAPSVLAAPARLAAAGAILLAVVVTARWAAVGAFAQAHDRGLVRRRVAVVSAEGHADPLVQRLRQQQSPLEYELVGVFGDDGPASSALGGLEDLRRLAQRNRIDVIVLCAPWRRPEALAQLIDPLQWISADLITPVDLPDHLRHPRLVAELAGIPMLQLVHHPLKGTEGLVKVVEDYVVAALALLVASPVMLAAAVAIRLTSEGPVLFRQTRMGLNGRLFEIYKFRTMRVDPGDDGSAQAVKGDSRITPVGALLRRTSIDELPQLFNVLRGEMSVVGPRPHVPNIVIGDTPYLEAVRSYAARHRIKPGLTGWAQINGARGGIHTPAKARAAVEADLHYIRHWSLRFDLEIMLKTFGHLLGNPTVF